MKLSSKSKNRIELLDVITEGISTQEVFKTINYKNQSEDKIIQFIFPHLVEELTQWVMEKKSLPKNLARGCAKAKQTAVAKAMTTP